MTAVNQNSFESSKTGLLTSNNANTAEACCLDNLCSPVCWIRGKLAVFNWTVNISYAKSSWCAVTSFLRCLPWHFSNTLSPGAGPVGGASLGNLLMAQLQVCKSLSRPIKISDMSEIYPTIQWAIRSRQSVLAPPERNIGYIASATGIWPDTNESYSSKMG